ncbi:branched-chain amino acid ABC transporter permease [Arthrobacter sp. GCM10027362]|uniref:ABC transporter permease subunit n=1 Tax=Arthrobacter sp. GCM10027362 TaxID=3273379 RepID=UPI003641A6BB
MDVFPSFIVGLGAGAIYATFGVLLTLMAMLTRVINFAQVAVGVFAAYLSLSLVGAHGSPLGRAALSIAAAAAISVVVGWVVSRWLAQASATARSAVTVAVLMGLLSLSSILFGTRPQPLAPLFVGPAFSSGPIVVTKAGVAMLVLAVAIAGAARLLLSYTSVGIRLRAISDHPRAAALLKVNVTGWQVAVWAFSGAVSGLAVFMLGSTQVSSASSMANLMVPAAAAALVGAFRSAELAIAGGLLIGGLQGLFTAFPQLVNLKDWVPILAVIVFLLWNQRKEKWDAAR